ncbi:hypothetical protein ACWC10_20220 [Streptomyces sp. NPDC001595]|uniref:hypothetical protein n=1 Tax=Streptomyces sp. NPDC001532 TaxID=3154520 RepID=UPI003321CE6E
MSITPSVPVLRGRKNTVLRFDGAALVLRQSDEERHIPLAAVASVRAERRTVEVALRAPAGSAPTVYRLEDLGEAAATAFADAVTAALPGAAEGSEAVTDGLALVSVRTTPDDESQELANRRRIRRGLLALAAVLVLESVAVSLAGDALAMIAIWPAGILAGLLMVPWARMMPGIARVRRLRRDGITVIAQYSGYVDGLYVYDFTDLGGRPYAYTPSAYRGERIEIVYDPADPCAGGERSHLPGRFALLSPALLLGLPALFCLLVTLLVVAAAFLA